jgi:hypothetical protein
MTPPEYAPVWRMPLRYWLLAIGGGLLMWAALVAAIYFVI